MDAAQASGQKKGWTIRSYPEGNIGSRAPKGGRIQQSLRHGGGGGWGGGGGVGRDVIVAEETKG